MNLEINEIKGVKLLQTPCFFCPLFCLCPLIFSSASSCVPASLADRLVTMEMSPDLECLQ